MSCFICASLKVELAEQVTARRTAAAGLALTAASRAMVIVGEKVMLTAVIFRARLLLVAGCTGFRAEGALPRVWAVGAVGR